jgi:hypothetical protein
VNAALVMARKIGTFPAADAVAALLAHGEQGEGVAILKDGTLWVLEDYPFHTEGNQAAYVLVPRSAEAGDTGTQVPNAGPWPPTHWPALGPSAEAGDTDD